MCIKKDELIGRVIAVNERDKFEFVKEVRYEKNPLRILDCKEEKCKELTKTAPKITDYLCDDCKAHFETLKSLLDVAGLKYTVNPYIVRGLDYYTKTVFEFVSENIGAQGTVCGGGRYDNLVGMFAKNAKISGVGYGMGDVTLENFLVTHDLIPNIYAEGVKVLVTKFDDVLSTFQKVQDVTNCSTGCGGCHDKILDAISEIMTKNRPYKA